MAEEAMAEKTMTLIEVESTMVMVVSTVGGGGEDSQQHTTRHIQESCGQHSSARDAAVRVSSVVPR